MDKITVWRSLSQEMRTCEYGQKHRVSLCAPKFLGPVIGKRKHDNGYEVNMTDLRKDYQGRIYHQRVEIDYSNNVSWLRDGDRAHFAARLPYNGIDIRTTPCKN